jgi:hypothetical protein
LYWSLAAVGDAAALRQEWVVATARHYLDEVTRLSRILAGEAAGSETASLQAARNLASS